MPRESVDANGPPLTNPEQVRWRMRTPVSSGHGRTNVYTDGVQYWWGYTDLIIRRITPEVFASLQERPNAA
jgi:hypothetical protein